MAINKNELCIELNKLLHESGWLHKATEYYQNHPECFNKCTNYDGFISSLTMSVSFQPETLADVKNVEPIVLIDMHNAKDKYQFYEGKHWTESSYNYSTAYRLPVAKEITFEQFFYIAEIHAYAAVHRWIAGKYSHTRPAIHEWCYRDWERFIAAADTKNGYKCFKDSRHVWLELYGSQWTNTRTGELEQDKVIVEVWYY